MKSNTLLLAFSMVATLAACGGGSSSNNTAVTSTTAPAAGSYLAFSSPNIVPPSTGTASVNGSGTATMVVGGKTANMSGFDIAGNATAVTGDFTKVIAFGGNSAFQLCRNADNSMDGTAGFKSAYSMTVANAQPVGLDEILGKSFKVYEDCAFSYDAKLNVDGTLTADEDSETAATVAAAFSPGGHTFTEAGVSANIRAAAYRITVNGTTYYAVIDRGNVVPYNGTVAYNALWISNPATP
ncbi:hypothetical protein [Noviherbaspirillum sp.]|uniref:hypothetical protein n=1 Tax=Noviherbaspirillum sp. TaxID=1926288 RepID=UPI002FE00692